MSTFFTNQIIGVAIEDANAVVTLGFEAAVSSSTVNWVMPVKQLKQLHHKLATALGYPAIQYTRSSTNEVLGEPLPIKDDWV